jgi:nitrogen fixation/metabolism regulation signal transduction histidine kinase
MAFEFPDWRRLRPAPIDSTRFALGVTVRAFVLGALACGLYYTAVLRPALMSTLVLAGLALLVVLDLARYADKADRVLSRFIASLTVSDPEIPAPKEGGMNGLLRLSDAIRRFTADAAEARRRQQRDIEYLRSLIDTVPAAIFVLEPDLWIAPLNRAAHKLSDRAAFGPDVVGKIAVVRPGTRAVVRLGTGQRVQVSSAQFSSAGSIKTLLSLQNIETELDAAEIKAWQDLVRILSHEMMNSLTPIISIAHSIRPLFDAPEPEISSDIVAAIDVIGDRSVGLMSFIERYRKVADLPRPIMRRMEVRDVLGGIETLYASTFAEKSVRYSSSVEPPELAILADPELIEQALINILRNAIDAVAGAEAPAIDISCRQDADQVVIEVADNGRGADEDTLERLFVPFFTTKPGGSGIGLSLVRQIVLAHGGQIEAVPNAAKGMTFRLGFANVEMDSGS